MRNQILLVALLLVSGISFAQDYGSGTGLRTHQIAASTTDNTVPLSVSGVVTYQLVTGQIVTVDPSNLAGISATDLQAVLEALDAKIVSAGGAQGLDTNADSLLISGSDGVLLTEVAPLQTLQVNGVAATPNAAGDATVTIPIDDADADPANEIQNISAGTGITVTPSGDDFTVINAAPDQTVVIADGGSGNVTVGGTYPNLTVDVSSLDDADADAENEAQQLSETGNDVTLSDIGGVTGGTVDVADETDEFVATATASQTAFTLPTAPAGGNKHQAFYRNGVKLKASEYSVAGTTLTLTLAVALGAGEEISGDWSL